MAELPLHYGYYLLLLLIPLLAAVQLLRRKGGAKAPRPPPSPWALPVIGHLHHLALAGALPHRALRDLARRLGGVPLMLLRLGELRVVVASSADAAREVMRTHDLAFATRPLGHTARALLGDGSLGLVFAPYGDGWRQLRRICTAELLSARRVRSFRAIREDEVRRLLRSVAAAAGEASRAVDLSEMVSAYVADASVRAIIGSKFKDRDTFLRLLERRLRNVPGQSLPDLFPSSRLATLVSPTLRLLKRQRQDMMAFIDTIIQEHQDSRGAAAAADDDEEDLLDVLLRIQREDELDPPLPTENIKAVIIDIFGGSSETSATTLQWAMAELMRNPRVMRKAQDEVRRVLAGQEIVTEDSLSGLRYLPLVIKEALRLHPPAPLLIPRQCRTPCRVLGFDVSAGVMFLVNAWAIGRDPRHWDAPEEFSPERFEGAAAVDFKGTDFEFIPFGAGRRMCPGIAFGLANMDLALASLLYYFDWALPDGAQPGELDMTEAPGMTARRLAHLLLVPTLRVPLQGE